MEYIEKKTFTYDGMGYQEWRAAMTVLVGLQRMMYSVDAGRCAPPFPTLSSVFEATIRTVPYLNEKVREDVLLLLDCLETGKTALCHGDFHPGNVMFDGNKHWIIDWGSASKGDPAADACMTYLYETRFGLPGRADEYLDMLCEGTGMIKGDVLSWLPVVAAYQLDINDAEDRKFIHTIIDSWHEGLCLGEQS